MDRTSLPLIIPVGAMIVAGIVIFGLSRVLLGVWTEENTMPSTFIALGVALGILVVASILAAQTERSNPNQ